MDDPSSAQLHQEVRDAVTRELSQRRPLLHHINADSSWLLQIPRPVVAATRKGGRAYYNVLIDPWLSGGQSDVARWFSQQWHRYESACRSVAEVEELAREVEIMAAGGLRLGKDRPATAADNTQTTFIDAVAISHEFTDHCHKGTLLDIDRFVPVFATESAANVIRSWNHFHHVATVPVFSRRHPDWRDASIPPLPEWLSISRLVEDGGADFLQYHSALVFSFVITSSPTPSSSTRTTTTRSARTLPNGWIPPADPDSDGAECILYTPHGIRPEALRPVVGASPPLTVLALVHGLHDVAINAGFWWERWWPKAGPPQPLQQLNLGGFNGLRAQRLVRAKYWIGTHDEEKWGSGLVNWFLRRRIVSVEEALRAERDGLVKEEDGGDEDEKMEGVLDDVRFEEVGNGESRVLL
ncbi:hypothetical protein SLS55_000218 [Diplodia seriata]|uniref:Uncharacterized protein n=1 Tax=Diplodia seriata TaxID=420778 RepID=A0A1S8B5A7_9PEZI|nr:hypothetical protein BK809_0006923 [Diplodia seriata]